MIFGNLFLFLFFFGLFACRRWFCLFVFTPVWDFQPDDAQVQSPLIVTRQNQQAAPVCSKVCWTCSGGLFCRCSIVKKSVCLYLVSEDFSGWFFLVGSTFSGYVRQETHQPIAKKSHFPDIGKKGPLFHKESPFLPQTRFEATPLKLVTYGHQESSLENLHAKDASVLNDASGNVWESHGVHHTRTKTVRVHRSVAGYRCNLHIRTNAEKPTFLPLPDSIQRQENIQTTCCSRKPAL